MKHLIIKTGLSFLLSFSTLISFSQDENVQKKIDSIEKTFNYEHGVIKLKN